MIYRYSYIHIYTLCIYIYVYIRITKAADISKPAWFWNFVLQVIRPRWAVKPCHSSMSKHLRTCRRPGFGCRDLGLTGLTFWPGRSWENSSPIFFWGYFLYTLFPVDFAGSRWDNETVARSETSLGKSIAREIAGLDTSGSYKAICTS